MFQVNTEYNAAPPVLLHKRRPRLTHISMHTKGIFLSSLLVVFPDALFMHRGFVHTKGIHHTLTQWDLSVSAVYFLLDSISPVYPPHLPEE